MRHCKGNLFIITGGVDRDPAPCKRVNFNSFKGIFRDFWVIQAPYFSIDKKFMFKIPVGYDFALVGYT